jgi:hypothetical protein
MKIGARMSAFLRIEKVSYVISRARPRPRLQSSKTYPLSVVLWNPAWNYGREMPSQFPRGEREFSGRGRSRPPGKQKWFAGVNFERRLSEADLRRLLNEYSAPGQVGDNETETV